MSEDRNAFRRKTAFVTGGGTGIDVQPTALAFAHATASNDEREREMKVSQCENQD